MTIIFSDIEKEWIEKEPFNWHIKEGCPEYLKLKILKKLSFLKIKQ